MKKIVAVIALTIMVFTQSTPAYALTWSDIKTFLVGPSATSTEEVSKENRGSTSKSEGELFSVLTSGILIQIAHAEEVDPDNESEEFSFEIKVDDTLWGKIDSHLDETYPTLTGDQKLYTIDRVVDELRAISREELVTYGISSGNIDLVYPGESIAFAVEATL